MKTVLDEIADYRHVIRKAVNILIDEEGYVGQRLSNVLNIVTTLEHHQELLDNVIEHVEDFLGEQFEVFIELKVRRGSND